MRGSEHNVSIFLNNVSKILIVGKIIRYHKAIYNLFESGIYHNPDSIFESNSHDFYNRNVGLFSNNNTRTAGYFMGIQRDFCMRKVPVNTI